TRRLPTSPLVPYPTLFRSKSGARGYRSLAARGVRGVDAANVCHVVGILRALVVAVALHAREPQREPPGVAGARLQVGEGDLDDQLGPDVHRPRIAPHLAREKLPGLPVEHRVGEALEGLAEHD